MTDTTPLRLHMPAIPHTITRSEFSHCAFTGKVQRFAPMMRARGFEVYHYGVGGSESGATEQIELMSEEEWSKLRIASYVHLHPEVTEEQARAHLENPASFIGDLGNAGTPLYQTFNARFRQELQKHYRSRATDLVCLPFEPGHAAAVNGLDDVCVESGIGYPNSSRNFRIFESYCWLHYTLGKEKKQCQNYWFVVPNYYDALEWPLSLHPERNRVGFLGRVSQTKGCHIIGEIARRFPQLEFILCGQGNPDSFLAMSPNIKYKPPLHGKERAEYLGSLVCLITSSDFIEPFCGVAVEAQLCGTPVVSVDQGAQTETISHGKTGLRCHTLEDFCKGVRLACWGHFDRAYIRERAVRKYSLDPVGKKYEYVFKSILDIYNGANGWYSPESHLLLE
jgi:hypothetical protein